MKDGWEGLAPRKTTKCPMSQFQYSTFPPTDFRAEIFRFMGESHVPYTRGGRNYQVHGSKKAPIEALNDWILGSKEAPIEALKDWKAVPLSSPK